MRRRAEVLLKHKLGAFLSSVTVLLALTWLLRSVLLLSQYSVELVYAFAFFLLLSNLVNVKLRSGAFGFLSSLSSSAGSFAIELSLAFFLGGFLGLEKAFTDYTLTLLVAGVLFFVASYLFGRLEAPHLHAISKEVIGIGGGELKLADNLSVKADAISGLPITIDGRMVGAVVLDDLELNINTTLGALKVQADNPVLILSSKLRRGAKIRGASEEELARAEEIYESRREQVGKHTAIKLPFLSVEEYDDHASEVRIGPMRVADTDEGSIVDIPPFIHIVDTTPRRSRVLVVSKGDTKVVVTSVGNEVKATWDGWRLKTDGETYTFIRRGNSYARDSAGSLIVGCPGYELSVSKGNVSLELMDIKIMATQSNLVLKSGEKVQRISNEGLSRSFIEAIVEIAKGQISELLSGMELDPADVYDEVDSLLKGMGERQ
ncbi:MAG: hypothetical protein QXF26_07745 [Candidatus Bathyarchaeia archaeon]